MLEILPYFQGVASVAVTVGILVALANFAVARRGLKNTRHSQIMNLVMNHNKMVFEREFWQIALDQYHRRSTDEFTRYREYFENSELGIFKLTWATRGLHSNHINLCAQVWALAGESERIFKSDFPGWEKFLGRLLWELSPANPLEDVPTWYKVGCKTIDIEEKDSIYSEKFINYINKLKNSLE